MMQEKRNNFVNFENVIRSSNTIKIKIQYLSPSSKKLMTLSKLETLQVGMDLDETWHDVIL